MAFVPPLDIRRVCVTCREPFYVRSRQAARLRAAKRPLPTQCLRCQPPAALEGWPTFAIPAWRDGTNKTLTCVACGATFIETAARLDWILARYGPDAVLPRRCVACRRRPHPDHHTPPPDAALEP